MKVAIIPARGGSKRIPGKNIRSFAGKPIIAYSIEVATEAGCFDRIIVSTDSEEIAAVAKHYGAEVPFLRPAEISGDHTGTADVLIHAICDAILGAAAKGDIGQHFPDSDKKYHNIDSTILLKECLNIVKTDGYNIGNIDTTIALQEPKIGPLIPEMRAKLARVMDIEIDQISIKATTEEKLGFTGREEGVAAHAVVLLNLDH